MDNVLQRAVARFAVFTALCFVPSSLLAQAPSPLRGVLEFFDDNGAASAQQIKGKR
jgi:hypothetical protein